MVADVVAQGQGQRQRPATRATTSSWPTLDDVKAELRVDELSDDDTAVLQRSLDAAIAWVSARVRPEAIADELGAVAVVPDVWLGTVLEACRLYRRRDSLDGTLGWGDAGLVRVGIFDPEVEHMLGHRLAIVL